MIGQKQVIDKANCTYRAAVVVVVVVVIVAAAINNEKMRVSLTIVNRGAGGGAESNFE